MVILISVFGGLAFLDFQGSDEVFFNSLLTL